jgi:hypothetical protein
MMINSFTNGSKYISAYVGSSSDPYFSMTGASAGMLRFNGDTRNFEVYDGNSWRMMSGTSASVSMNPVAENAIDWASKKMQEEKEWEELAKTNSSVKIALDNLEQSKHQLRVTATLAKETANSYSEVAEVQA